MKDELRNKYKMLRKEISDKDNRDLAINDNFLSSNIYKNSELILCYYPLKDEINTLKIIKTALNDNKKIALPVALNKNGDMEFYYIDNLKDLNAGMYGIMEPNKVKPVKNFNKAICVVPGLVFDKLGYRLGYGKGYYDRFLRRFKGIIVGLCYEEFITNKLPINKYDIPVNVLCNERELIEF